MSVAAAAAGSQGLWFVSRASGLVLLVLFSVVVVLGVSTRLGSAPRRWPRFVFAELHRTLALFSVAFLALHVMTAILDPFVSIGWAATVLPFLSSYRTLAIGLGTLAVNLGGAVLVTSLLRRRLGFGAWRAVHWLAYLAWPVAFVHSLTAGNDLGIWWVVLVEWGSAAAVATAVLARLMAAVRHSAPAGLRLGMSGSPRGNGHLGSADHRQPSAPGGARRHASAGLSAPPAASGSERWSHRPGRAPCPVRPTSIVRFGPAAPEGPARGGGTVGAHRPGRRWVSRREEAGCGSCGTRPRRGGEWHGR